MAISLHSLDEYLPRAGSARGTINRPTSSAARSRLTAARRAVQRENSRWADLNRRDADSAGVQLINLLSVQGAGKTSLITETMFQTTGRLRIGSVQSRYDGHQLANVGAVVDELGAEECASQPGYLDAGTVRASLTRFPLSTVDVLFVQNRCSLDEGSTDSIGEHQRVMIYATTQGHLEPARHPELFRGLDLVVLTKMDLDRYVDFDLECFRENLHRANPRAQVLPVSSRTGEGIDSWVTWLLARRG